MKFDKQYLVRNSAITTGCRGVGVAAAFVLDAVIMATFGLSSAADVFFSALAVPLLLSSAVGTQFGLVLVPMVARIDAQSGRTGTWEFLSKVISSWVSLVSVACLIGTLAADYLMPLLVPGLDPVSLKLAASIAKVLLWLVVIRGVGDILGSFLYAFHKYWLASFSRAITSIFTILPFILLQSHLGIHALAIGFVFGSLCQCALLWAALVKQGFKFRIRLQAKDPDIQILARLMIYPTLGQMLSETRGLVENCFASYSAPGVLSGLKYATRIVTSISGIMVSSVVTATLPIVSQNVATNQIVEMKKNILRGAKLLILLSVPLSAWLVFNGDSLVRLLFERGKFAKGDALLISAFLSLLTPYILFGRIVSLTQIPFYASMDTKTPLWGMIVAFAVYLAVTPVSVYLVGVYGFCVSTSLTAILAAAIMAYLLRKAFGPVGWLRLGGYCAKILLAVFVSCCGYVIARRLFGDGGMHTLGDKLRMLVIPSIFGMGGFLLASKSLGILDAVAFVRGMAGDRFSKRGSAKA